MSLAGKLVFVWVGGALAVALLWARLAAHRLCDDGPAGVHCECRQLGGQCCYCEWGDGGHSYTVTEADVDASYGRPLTLDDFRRFPGGIAGTDKGAT